MLLEGIQSIHSRTKGTFTTSHKNVRFCYLDGTFYYSPNNYGNVPGNIFRLLIPGLQRKTSFF